MRKNLGKLMVMLFVMLMGNLGLQGVQVVSAADTEIENNDEYASANELGVNDSITGNVGEYYDKDYYKVVTSMNGKLEIAFNHTYANSSASWEVILCYFESGEYKELSNTNVCLNGNEKVRLPYIGAVSGGEYYIIVKREVSGVEGHDYTIETSFIPSEEYEKEKNDIYATANRISINGTCSGNINNSSDVDCYQVVPDVDGKLSVSFFHTYQEEYGTWAVKMYYYLDGEYLLLSDNRIELKSNEKINLPCIGAVQNGIYYICVKRDSMEISGINYTINTSFKPTQYFEKERNDSYAEATAITINKTFGGTINSDDDIDYYKLAAPVRGNYKVCFAHKIQDNYGGWNVSIYLYKDGEYTELCKQYVGAKDNEKVYLPSVGMHANGTYFVKVERCSTGITGKIYKFRVKKTK